MRASVMLEKGRQKYAVILAFDVPVTKEARELSESLGVKIFTADIIYHLFDQFTAYLKQACCHPGRTSATKARLKMNGCWQISSTMLVSKAACLWTSQQSILDDVKVCFRKWRDGSYLVAAMHCKPIGLGGSCVPLLREADWVVLTIHLRKLCARCGAGERERAGGGQERCGVPVHSQDPAQLRVQRQGPHRAGCGCRGGYCQGAQHSHPFLPLPSAFIQWQPAPLFHLACCNPHAALSTAPIALC